MAVEAAVFVDHLAAAIRAGTHVRSAFGGLDLGVVADHPADGIRAGEDLVAVDPGRRGAADPGKLADDGTHGDAGAQGQGNQSAGGLDLR